MVPDSDGPPRGNRPIVQKSRNSAIAPQSVDLPRCNPPNIQQEILTTYTVLYTYLIVTIIVYIRLHYT